MLFRKHASADKVISDTHSIDRSEVQIAFPTLILFDVRPLYRQKISCPCQTIQVTIVEFYLLAAIRKPCPALLRHRSSGNIPSFTSYSFLRNPAADIERPFSL